MAATIAAARRSTFLRNLYKTTNKPTPIFQHRRIISSPLVSHSPTRLRFLSSLLPYHSATASARLISDLSTDMSKSIQGRFANYVSPI